jgi:protein phosphatase 1 regulatory subunit 42
MASQDGTGRSQQKRAADEKQQKARQTHLRLERRGIRNVAPHLQAFPSLQVLYLFDNKINTLDGLYLVPLLTHLYVQHNQLAAIDLSPLRKLQKLYLDGNLFSSLESLDSLGDASSLIELHASNQETMENQPLHLTPEALVRLSSLQVISLSGNRLSDVAPLAGLPSLTKVDLSRNNLAEFQAIAPLLEHARGIVELNLAGNPLTASRRAMELAIMSAPSLRMINGRELLPTERVFLQQMHQPKKAVPHHTTP